VSTVAVAPVLDVTGRTAGKPLQQLRQIVASTWRMASPGDKGAGESLRSSGHSSEDLRSWSSWLGGAHKPTVRVAEPDNP